MYARVSFPPIAKASNYVRSVVGFRELIGGDEMNDRAAHNAIASASTDERAKIGC